MLEQLTELLPRLEFCAQHHQCSINELITRWLNIDEEYEIDKLVVFAQVIKEMPVDVVSKALRESKKHEAELLSLFNDPSNAVLIANNEGHYIDCNAVSCHIFGMEKDQLIGNSIANFVVLPENADIENVWTSFLDRGYEEGEIVIRRPDGFQRTLEYRAYANYREGQHISFLHDITEQKLAQARLIQSETRFRQVIESAPTAILIADANGLIVLINHRLEALFGYSRDELIDHPIEILLPARIHQVHHQDVANFFAAPDLRPMGAGRELAGRRKDGTEFPVEIGLSYISNAEGTISLAFITDITERKMAEEVSAYSTAIIQSSQDAIIGKTLDGLIVSWNTGAEKMYGYAAHEAIGHPISLVVPAERANEVPDILARIKQGETVHHYETIRVRKDGTKIGVSLTVSPIRSTANLIVGASIIARDITEQQRVAAALLESERFALATVNALSAHIAILDEQGTILKVNRAWKKFGEANQVSLDYDWEGVNYLTVCDASGQDAQDARAVANGIRSIINGDLDEFDNEYPCHSLTEQRWFAVRATRFSGIGPVRVAIAHENITQRKLAELAAQRDEANLQAILDNSALSYVLMDANQRVIIANKVARLGAQAVFGRSMQPGDSFVEFLSDWNRNGFYQNFDAALRGEVVTSELNFTTLTGQLRYFTFRYFPAFTSDGKVLGVCLSSQDITQRKQAEQALSTSESRLSQAIRIAGLGIWDWDIVTDRVEWFGNMYRIYGIDPETFTGKGQDYINATRADYRELQMQNIASMFENGVRESDLITDQAIKTDPKELCIVRPDGSECFTLGDAVCIVDESGKPVRMLGATYDITERRQAEDALRKSQQQLRLITDNITDMIMQCDETGITQYVSLSSEEVWGIKPDKLIGTHVTDWLGLVHPDDRESLTEMLAQRLLTGQGLTQCVYRFQHAQGQFRWLEHKIGSFTKENGSLGGFIFAIRDITERIKANEDLQKAEARFSKVFHASPIGISICTLDEGRYVEVNDSFIKMCGFEHEGEIIGQTIADLGIWANSDNHATFTQMLRGTQSRKPFSVPFRHQSGELHEALCSAEIIELGGKEFCISMYQDVTSQRRADAELDFYRQHLEVLVDARTLELGQLNLKLHQEVIDRRLAENAEREQRLLAEALRNIAVALNLQLELGGVYDEIMTNIGNIVSHDAASLIVIEGETAQLVRLRGFGDSSLENEVIPVSELQLYPETVSARRSLLVSDLSNHRQFRLQPPFSISSYMVVPLINAGEIIGIMCVYSKDHNHFTETNLSQLEMFAEQATVAIHKAHMHKQSNEAAIWRERQQFARNLHDAVTQTIFSASIITETLLKLSVTQPDKVYDGLLQLRRLIRGAVAESRNLLFELRPESLEDADLSRLLLQIADAFEGRTGIRPQVNFPADIQMPQAVKVTLYWITNEALNNIEKHARATEVDIDFIASNGHIRLLIRDNGLGFTVNSVKSTQLGLKIMRERASSINATMQIVSLPNPGTVISVDWEGDLDGS
jgi:PAS domain S-box-containing protein